MTENQSTPRGAQREEIVSEHSGFDLEDMWRMTLPILIKHAPTITLGLRRRLRRIWAFIRSKWSENPESPSLYSFSSKLVDPLLVHELIGWISDRGQEIVAVDIERFSRSNRFSGGGFAARIRNSKQWVESRNSETGEYFGYRQIATSPSGVEMLLCHESGGGSSIFCSVVLLCFEDELTLETEIEGNEKEGFKRVVVTRERTLLKIIGHIALGDKYSGKVEYKNGFLIIGPDEGWYRRGEETTNKLRVR